MPQTRPPLRIMDGAPPAAGAQATLANWRRAPWSRWAFQHVRELIPTAEIACAAPAPLERDDIDLGALSLPDGPDGEIPLARLLGETVTAAFVVLRGGRLVYEWYDGHDGLRPHILFSVSKSLTGLVAGILADRGLLDPEAPVGTILPEIAGSAYSDATVRHVLDMTVSTDFDESYLDPTGDYQRYRVATGWNPAPDGAPATDLRSFLATVPRAAAPHGRAVHYVSPNSDLLGWLIERASGRRAAELLGALLWEPAGAEAPASITLDRLGAPRTAGGISARPRDLARIGELVRRRGIAGGRAVVPGWWLDDMATGGDPAAWARGDLRALFPNDAARYRAQWYATGQPSGAIAGIGIHGQWLWIDPEAEVVIVRLAAQPEPVCDATDARLIAAFDALARALG